MSSFALVFRINGSFGYGHFCEVYRLDCKQHINYTENREYQLNGMKMNGFYSDRVFVCVF